MTEDPLVRETRKAAAAAKRWNVYTWIITALVAVPCVAGCITAVVIIVIW